MLKRNLLKAAPEPTFAPIVMIAISKMHSDPRVQRIVIYSKVDAIVKEGIIPHKFKSITLNKRTNGKLYIVDGQHRVLAWKKLFPEMDSLLPCEIISIGDWEQEKAEMDRINLWCNRKGQASDVRRDVLAKKSPWYLLELTLNRFQMGLRIEDRASGVRRDWAKLDCFCSVRTIDASTNFPEGLEAVLRVYAASWRGKVESSKPAVFEGAARFLALYGERCGEAAAIKLFKAVEPIFILEQSHHVAADWTPAERVCRALCDQWNRKHPTKKLVIHAQDSPKSSIW